MLKWLPIILSVLLTLPNAKGQEVKLEPIGVLTIAGLAAGFLLGGKAELVGLKLSLTIGENTTLGVNPQFLVTGIKSFTPYSGITLGCASLLTEGAVRELPWSVNYELNHCITWRHYGLATPLYMVADACDLDPKSLWGQYWFGCTTHSQTYKNMPPKNELITFTWR